MGSISWVGEFFFTFFSSEHHPGVVDVGEDGEGADWSLHFDLNESSESAGLGTGKGGGGEGFHGEEMQPDALFE